MPNRKQRIDQQQTAIKSEESTMKPENESTSTSQAGTTAPDKAEHDLSAVNPFDPNRFRRKTLAAAVGTQAGLTKCSLVKKPNPDQFVRASTDPELSDFPCTILELGTAREEYLLLPHVADQVVSELPTLVKDVALTLGVDRLGNLFLWRTVPAEAPNGDNAWNASGRLALAAAQKQWVRVESDTVGGYYKYHVVKIDIPEPVWPSHTMGDYLQLAFAGLIIEEVSHPVIQRMLGNSA